MSRSRSGKPARWLSEELSSRPPSLLEQTEIDTAGEAALGPNRFGWKSASLVREYGILQAASSCPQVSVDDPEISDTSVGILVST
jgi:hypothetical protein